ncbi:unnamed protein product, partial [Owenia fusiformis]
MCHNTNRKCWFLILIMCAACITIHTIGSVRIIGYNIITPNRIRLSNVDINHLGNTHQEGSNQNIFPKWLPENKMADHISQSTRTGITKNDDNMVGVSPFGLSKDTNPWLVLYNRLPKSGSTTLRSIFEILSKTNNYTFLQSREFHEHHLDSGYAMNAFIKSFGIKQQKVVFERHIHFMDFTAFDVQQPAYINLIRDPIEQVQSRY